MKSDLCLVSEKMIEIKELYVELRKLIVILSLTIILIYYYFGFIILSLVCLGLQNFYGGIHGGAVAALSERMAIGCARTVVGEDKEIFLGELSISYLSAAPKNAELIIDGSVVRSGRNLTVVAIEFKFKNSGKLACTSRGLLFITPPFPSYEVSSTSRVTFNIVN
ncbi:hypothetical protein Patl1_00379 [Pistacia atlantica]|uniref:Uncharacterized protein n=1 Tax=Pistacia atlantica TaxID=434234 RepID=A0ACC1C856_9ROSI|nr:hypothetical protein Patl1_00379 [Pistacia atlantica]